MSLLEAGRECICIQNWSYCNCLMLTGLRHNHVCTETTCKSCFSFTVFDTALNVLPLLADYTASPSGCTADQMYCNAWLMQYPN